LPSYERLPHGYGVVAIRNVNNIDELTRQLASILKDPTPLAAVGMRGRRFALQLQENDQFPEIIEQILAAAAARKRMPSTANRSAEVKNVSSPRFPLTELIVKELTTGSN